MDIRELIGGQMHKTAYSLVLMLAPAMLAAQVSGTATATTNTNARVSTPAAQADAQSSASVDAQLALAREHHVPEQPIRRRVAEGRAKGATETQLAASARQLRLDLEASAAAMVRASRTPSDAETERGAYLIERGYTSVQLETVAKSAPSDRSLVVAFDVLSDLRARGVASERAITQVASKLQARASDESLRSVVAANANAGANARVGRGVGANVNGAANAAAGATAGAASTGAGVAGSVTGAVGGVIKKP